MSFRQFLVNERRNTYDYSSLMIELPEYLSDSIISWGYDHICNEELFLDPEDPTFGREDDIHITVIYGMHTVSQKEVKQQISEKSFEVELGELALFTKSTKFDVLIINVECPTLHILHDKIQQNLEVTKSHPEYIPHVTIAYLKKGAGDKFVGVKDFEKEKFKADKLIFSSKTGVKSPIKLGTK